MSLRIPASHPLRKLTEEEAEEEEIKEEESKKEGSVAERRNS